MCSISCAIASDEGRGFFSAVSAFLRVALSNSLTLVRLESLASSTWRMEEGEAGSLVLTVLNSTPCSTPCNRPCMVFSVWISSAPGSTNFSFVSVGFKLSHLNASIPGTEEILNVACEMTSIKITV